MNLYAPAYKPHGMWEIVPERLKAAMDHAGVNQSRLAKLVGVQQPSIGRLLTGETKTSRALDRIAVVLGTSVSYLKGLDDDPSGELTAPAPREHSIVSEMGLVPVRELDLALGFGAAYLDQDIASAVRYFPREWLDLYTRAPSDKLIITHGSGDSMVPTFFDQDLILIDTSDRAPRLTDQVWAVTYCGLGSVKRLRPTNDGGWLLLSDNPTISPITAYDEEMHVLGRVCAYFRKM